MTTIETRALLLTQGYEPIRLITWQRALTLLTLDKIEVVETYDRGIKTSHLLFKAPAVVRLMRGFRRHRKQVKFSRVNIYARDKYRCQYCGAKSPISDLTYDHVLPRAQGGATTWTNIVTCCYRCNRYKGNRTPAKAKMSLLSEPVQPRWVPAVSIQISTTSVPDAWRDYLYWTVNLEG